MSSLLVLGPHFSRVDTLGNQILVDGNLAPYVGIAGKRLCRDYAL